MTKHCYEIGIPAYLHQNEKPALPIFGDEFLYRRFFVHPPKSTWLGKENRHKSAAIFKLENDSYNCSQFSKHPADVLFNIHAKNLGEHFIHWGILSLSIQALLQIEVSVEVNGDSFRISFRPVHKPEVCMYPHTELHAYKDDNFINEVAPKSVRAIVRDLLVETCEIVKVPEEV